MGYFRHKTIIVSGWLEHIRAAHEEFDLVLRQNYPDLLVEPSEQASITQEPTTLLSGVVVSPSNGFAHFFIAPDGSKEGWPTSNEGDRAFAQIKALLTSSPHCDQLDWVELQMGGDDGVAAILETNLREWLIPKPCPRG